MISLFLVLPRGSPGHPCWLISSHSMPFYDFSPWLGAYLKNEMNHKYALWSILHGFPIKEGHTLRLISVSGMPFSSFHRFLNAFSFHSIDNMFPVTRILPYPAAFRRFRFTRPASFQSTVPSSRDTQRRSPILLRSPAGAPYDPFPPAARLSSPSARNAPSSRPSSPARSRVR